MKSLIALTQVFVSHPKQQIRFLRRAEKVCPPQQCVDYCVVITGIHIEPRPED